MFKFFFLIIKILVTMSDLPTIFRCTPWKFQIERRLNEDKKLESNDTKNGWINYRFNSRYVHIHQLGMITPIVVLHKLEMEAIK